MALHADFVFEVRLTGDDTNGGGFKSSASGTDRTLQDAAHATLTTASVVHTTTTQLNVSAANYTVSAADIGNAVQIAGGTATAGVYEITAVDVPNNRWTVDRALGTSGQTCPGKMGGAFASPGKAASVAVVVGHIVYIKYNASPYIATSATINIAAGCVSGTSGTAYVGYDTIRALYTYTQNRPTFRINTAVSTATLFGNLNAMYSLQSIILDGNSQATSRCYNSSGECFNVKVMNAITMGMVQNTTTSRAILCEATNCTASPISMAVCLWCVAHSNTAMLINTGAITASIAYGCITYNNNRSGIISTALMLNCVSYDNDEYGFNMHNTAGISIMINCIAESNTLNGFRTNTGGAVLVDCASFGNTRWASSGGGKLFGDFNPITGSSSFFTNAAGLDFTLNNAAGGGALARATGFPATFAVPVNTMTNYMDVGAAQHQDMAVQPTYGVGV